MGKKLVKPERKKKVKREIPNYSNLVDVAVNPNWTLAQWGLFIHEQVQKYGKRSVLRTTTPGISFNLGKVIMVLEKRR